MEQWERGKHVVGLGWVSAAIFATGGHFLAETFLGHEPGVADRAGTSALAKVCNWQGECCVPDGAAAMPGQGGWSGRQQPRRRSGRREGGCVRECCEPGAAAVSRPLYQLKAEFFKTLGHPARIRVLELLSEREHGVAELVAVVGIEASNLSQHLATLRRANLVATRKEGSAVHYSVTSPQVAELLAVARAILTGVLSEQVELLEDLRTY